VAIDYRYHFGSIVAIFVALLLGILVGIGLAPNPEEYNQKIADLKKEYQETRSYRDEELKQAQVDKQESDTVAKEAVAAAVTGRLMGRRIALVLNHRYSREVADNLRALLTQAGATVTSTTTFTADFITMPEAVRTRVSQALLLYPPADTPFRTAVAQALARDLALGQAKLAPGLQEAGLIQSTPGSTYNSTISAVLFVGGMDAPTDAAPEQIDVPFLAELTRLNVRVVACEPKGVKLSSVPVYKAQKLTTVDDADTLAGRLALIYTLQGADGSFGVKSTADRLLPAIPGAE
jgi:hypothetical protein